MHLSRLSIVLFTALIAQSIARGAEPGVIFDMDSVVHAPTEFADAKQIKHKAGTADAVDGKFGKAVKFSFVEGAVSSFFTASVRPTPEWDRADGFSFWVKGDGSKSFGGLELIDRDDFSLRYGYCFPTDSTDWQKITVRWSDLVPELRGPLVDPKKGFAPSHFGNFWFGKWFYYREFPAVSYAVDQVMLERAIPAGAPQNVAEGLTRLRTKLAAKQPITIVTMGDSLSDKHHWANHDTVWSELLAKSMKEKYGSDITLINPAIGGTTLSQNIVLIPRWARETPKPDLVIVWFGGNDWETGVRGPLFIDYLRLAVDRIRQQTGGDTEILLLTTSITFDRWDESKEMEVAVKNVAKEKKTGVVDIAAEFRKLGNREAALKQTIWAWDKVHLGKFGHETTANTIMQALAAP